MLVGPDTRPQARALGSQADALHGGDDVELAAGGDHGVELHGSSRRRQQNLRCLGVLRPGGRRRSLNGHDLDRLGLWVGAEEGGRCGHVQRLVRPRVVVGVHPLADGSLGGRQAGEGPAAVQQFTAQGAVPTFDLPGGGRRVRLGQLGADPVLPADPLEEDLGGAGPGEAAGELLAVVGEHLGRDPVDSHGAHERVGHRPARRRGQNLGDHDEAGVIVDAGEHLALPPVGEVDATDQVELPQVHRRLALPALVLARVPLVLRAHEPVAGQHPVDGGPRRRRIRSGPLNLVGDPPSSPARVRPPHLADQGLHRGRQPSRTGLRPTRCLPKAIETGGDVLRLPGVDRLPGHPIAKSDLSDRRTVQHLQDRPVPLLDQPVARLLTLRPLRHTLSI